MDLASSGMDLQETQSVVGLHVDADDLTMDEQQAGVELVAGGQQQDWCHVSQAPMQVRCRLLMAPDTHSLVKQLVKRH